MTISSINGIGISTLSAINGVSKTTLSAINGQSIAAIALVNTTHGSDYTGAPSAAISATASSHTSGNLIVVFFRWFRIAQNCNSVTDTAGNTYTFIARVDAAAGERDEIWYAKNITGNAANVVIANLSAPAQFYGMVVAQYSGLDTVAPFDATASGAVADGNVAVTSGSFTTAQAAEILVAAGEVAAVAGTWTPDTGYTLEVQDASNVTVLTDKIVVTIQTGVTATLTSTSNVHKQVLVATFKAA